MQRIDVKMFKLYRGSVCMMVGRIIYFSLSRQIAYRASQKKARNLKKGPHPDPGFICKGAFMLIYLPI